MLKKILSIFEAPTIGGKTVQKISVEAKITRADGTIEDKGTVVTYDFSKIWNRVRYNVRPQTNAIRTYIKRVIRNDR